MTDVQDPAQPTETRPAQSSRTTPSSHTSSRLFRSILVGIGITLILSTIELVLIWLFNPFHLSTHDSLHRLITTLTIPVSIPISLVVPAVELLGITFLAFRLIRPLAIRAYLRTLQQDIERYRSQHTLLPSLENAYEMNMTYYQQKPDPNAAQDWQPISPISLPDFTQLQDTALFLLGDTGAGKTFALHVYQSFSMQQRMAIVRGQKQIPIYLRLQDYALFLAERQQSNTSALEDADALKNSPPSITLFDFLYESDLPGIRHLRPHLWKLIEQDRLLLLCDGLDEVDAPYRSIIGKELAGWMMMATCRFIIACREFEYRELPQLVALIEQDDLVQQGHIGRVVIGPLQNEQIRSFVEGYVQGQGDQWRYTAGQVMQALERSPLRHLYSSPLQLTVWLEIFGKVRGEVKTQGRLLQAYTAQAIEREQKQPHWNGTASAAPSKQEIVQLLSAIASAARWSHTPYALQLPLPSHHGQHPLQGEALADAVLTWLDEHHTHGPFGTGQSYQSSSQTTVATYLQCAENAGLIEISPDGILSFQHALLADYLVADYFLANSSDMQRVTPAKTGELLAQVDYWCKIVALWAGLVHSPIQLAEQFALQSSTARGKTGGGTQVNTLPAFPAETLPSLLLSLTCIGVACRASTKSEITVLPAHLATSLKQVVDNPDRCREFAHLFTQSEGRDTQELYFSIPSLLVLEGIENWLVLLDTESILTYLFSYLFEIIDLPIYEEQVKRLCRVLWHFGEAAVSRAGRLTQQIDGVSIRLRSAAITILRGTQSVEAVKPLISCLQDTEYFIVDRAIKALEFLGPERSIPLLRQELQRLSPSTSTRPIYQSVLSILAHFLGEQRPAHQLSVSQCQPILDAIIPILAANFATEPELQQQTMNVCIRAGTLSKSVPQAPSEVAQATIAALLLRLSANDEMLVRNVIRTLQEIGPAATPTVIERLSQPSTDTIRGRLLEILSKVRDLQALPAILHCLADPSPLVQRQVVHTLNSFLPESIPALIELLLSHPHEQMAEKAAYLLGGMGEKAAIPVSQALSHTIPGRTRLLVQVLERIHDPRAISALISLLKRAPNEPLLAVAVIRTLSQFRERRIVMPLLETLANPQIQIYEETIDALSYLGEIALDDLLVALDTKEETVTTPRVRRAILGMIPFPGEFLLNQWQQCSEALAHQIGLVFRMQGADAALLLVQHLFHEHGRIRRYVHATLIEMPGPAVVPALLEVLDRPTWRQVVTDLLLRYTEAIPPLVELLGDSEHGLDTIAAEILPRFGADVLPPLVSALDDLRNPVQEYGQVVMINLVRQQPAALSQVVRLFTLSLPVRAHEAVLEVLTTDLASSSIPALLDGLEDAHLVNDVSEALVRLARKGEWQRAVLGGLLKSLRREERRRGAETALVKAGGLAVPDVGELMTDPDQIVAKSAQHILSQIGAPALPYIWAAHNDDTHPARRDAAVAILQGMSTEVIKEALVTLLSTDKPADMGIALALLMERVQDEEALPSANHEMIPTLLEYVQVYDREPVSLRILSMLLLLGGEMVVSPLVQLLYDYPEHHEQLAHAFLFLGIEARDALIDICNDPYAPPSVRAEATGMLGLLGSTKDLYDYAQSLSRYGLTNNQATIQYPDQLAIALRALGSLLVSGDWDTSTLQSMRRLSHNESAQSELYSILLGWRYQPEIQRLNNELQHERDARTNEIVSLTGRIVQDQERIHELEREIDQIQHEHGMRGHELNQVSQDKEALQDTLSRASQDNLSLQTQIAQLQTVNANLLREVEELRSMQ